jgi:hypothetical protein
VAVSTPPMRHSDAVTETLFSLFCLEGQERLSVATSRSFSSATRPTTPRRGHRSSTSRTRPNSPVVRSASMSIRKSWSPRTRQAPARGNCTSAPGKATLRRPNRTIPRYCCEKRLHHESFQAVIGDLEVGRRAKGKAVILMAVNHSLPCVAPIRHFKFVGVNRDVPLFCELLPRADVVEVPMCITMPADHASCRRLGAEVRHPEICFFIKSIRVERDASSSGSDRTVRPSVDGQEGWRLVR